MMLRIAYPQLSSSTGHDIYEDIEVKEMRPGVAELTSHTIFIPLAPGDLVTYSSYDADGCFRTEDYVTGIETLVDVYTYDVDFMLPANLVLGQALPDDDPAQVKIDELLAEWTRDAWCTQHTGLSAYVSAQTEDWLTDKVVLSPYVDHIEVIRRPGMAIDWDVCVAHADLGDLTRGPWA